MRTVFNILLIFSFLGLFSLGSSVYGAEKDPTGPGLAVLAKPGQPWIGVSGEPVLKEKKDQKLHQISFAGVPATGFTPGSYPGFQAGLTSGDRLPVCPDMSRSSGLDPPFSS